MPESSPSLLDALRARDALLPGEESILRSPEVRALSARAQLEHLSSNRRVGRVVTALAGGVRFTFLAGGLVALVALVIDGTLALAWWMPFAWLAGASLVLWLLRSWLARVRALGAMLPTLESLGLDD